MPTSRSWSSSYLEDTITRIETTHCFCLTVHLVQVITMASLCSIPNPMAALIPGAD